MQWHYRLTKFVAFALAAGLALPAAAGVTPDQVMSTHIREADGTASQNTNSGAGVKTGHIQNLAVTEAKIANGAVTDAKISGVISASKLGAHKHPYAGVVIVAKSGGDYIEPIAALASIIDASSTKPYLVKIMPGVYDLGSSALNMLPFVDVEGSGESTTVIRSSVENEFFPSATGTVNGADNSEIRFLTVEAVGLAQSSKVVGIGTSGSAFKMTNVTVKVDSGMYGEGIVLMASAAVMTNVTITSTAGNLAYGVYNDSSSPIMSNVAISVSSTLGGAIGIFDIRSAAVMNQVTISAQGYSVGRGIWSRYANDRLSNATISAESSWGAEGQADAIIRNDTAGCVMTNVDATARGGATNNGIILRGPAGTAATLSNVNVTASGGNTSRALLSDLSVALSNVTAIASASGFSIGLELWAGSVLADRSTFVGAYSVWNSATELRIGASKLVGTIGGAAPTACAASYNGSYAPLDASCQ